MPRQNAPILVHQKRGKQAAFTDAFYQLLAWLFVAVYLGVKGMRQQVVQKWILYPSDFAFVHVCLLNPKTNGLWGRWLHGVGQEAFAPRPVSVWLLDLVSR